MSQHPDCIFCKICAGEIPCAKVYEDEHVLAFLDIAPVTKGHCLVIPKNHYTNILEINTAETPHVFNAIQKIAPAVMKSVGAKGFNIVQNNFEAAGQTVFHVHFHIVPRVLDDKVIVWHHGQYESTEAMLEVANSIHSHIKS